MCLWISFETPEGQREKLIRAVEEARREAGDTPIQVAIAEPSRWFRSLEAVATADITHACGCNCGLQDGAEVLRDNRLSMSPGTRETLARILLILAERGPRPLSLQIEWPGHTHLLEVRITAAELGDLSRTCNLQEGRRYVIE